MSPERLIDCELIRGTVLRPYLGKPLTDDELERLLRGLPGPPVLDLGSRWDEEERVFAIDWHQGELAYTAGLYQGELTFVNIGFTGVHALDAVPPTAGELIGCLGTPSQVQAWFDAYPDIGHASLHATLVFIPQRAIAFAVRHYNPVPATAPPLDCEMPVSLIALFGEQWAQEQRVLARSDPWPGEWARVPVETHIHEAPPEEANDGGED